MIYKCTKDVLKALKVEASEEPEIYNGLFSWSVKLTTIGRRKLLYLMNDASRASIVLFGVTAKEFKDFNVHVVNGIRMVLEDMGIKEEIIDSYVKDSGSEIYTGSGTRKQLGNLNLAVREAEWFFDDYMEAGMVQRHLCHHQNNGISKNDQGDYVRPSEVMKHLLERTYGEAVKYDLDEIGIQMFNWERYDWLPYLNIRNGTIVQAERDSEESYELDEDEDYVYIREMRYDFFREFYRFAESVEDVAFLAEIEKYGHGSGAIGRIKRIIDDYPEIREQWFRFRDELERGIVVRWLKSIGLE